MAEMETTDLHQEPHSNLSEFVQDVILGMADGLTVPFAIAAGLASAAADHMTIIIAAVVSEIAAGSISMGLGGFLAAKTESDHYHAERERESWEVDHKPEVEAQEVIDALHKYGLTTDEGKVVIESLKKRKNDWIDFMMRFELGLEKPDANRALKSAVTIGGSYVVGGLIPLAPYLVLKSVSQALLWSVVLTIIALAVFGYLRGYVLGARPWKSLWQTVLVGSLAAAVAFLLARFVA